MTIGPRRGGFVMRGAPRAGASRPVRDPPSRSSATTTPRSHRTHPGRSRRRRARRSLRRRAAPRRSGSTTMSPARASSARAIRRSARRIGRDVPFVADHRAEQDIVLAIIGRQRSGRSVGRFGRLPARRSRLGVRSLAQIGAREHRAERPGRCGSGTRRAMSHSRSRQNWRSRRRDPRPTTSDPRSVRSRCDGSYRLQAIRSGRRNRRRVLMGFDPDSVRRRGGHRAAWARV